MMQLREEGGATIFGQGFNAPTQVEAAQIFGDR
jgi:hypothetical protein